MNKTDNFSFHQVSYCMDEETMNLGPFLPSRYNARVGTLWDIPFLFTQYQNNKLFGRILFFFMSLEIIRTIISFCSILFLTGLMAEHIILDSISLLHKSDFL